MTYSSRWLGDCRFACSRRLFQSAECQSVLYGLLNKHLPDLNEFPSGWTGVDEVGHPTGEKNKNKHGTQFKIEKNSIKLNFFTSQVVRVKNRQKFHISFGWSHHRISSTEPPSKTTIHPYWLQGATEVSFTAYHSGKLELVRTRPKVISNSRKKIFDEQD